MENRLLIFELDNFISPETCDRILDWFKKEKRLETNEGNSLFNNRTIPYNSINNLEVKQLVNGFRFDATSKARELFNKKLYPDYTDLVYWPSGMSMDVHADAVWLDGSPAMFPYRFCAGVCYLNDDAVWLDGSPAMFPYRFCAGVCYLNDDYQGGETYFPNFNIESKPKKGKVVLFPSNLEYQHGVREVVGERYTMPLWFSENVTNLEN